MKLLKSPVQKPGSDLGGSRHIPCGIRVARAQVWQGPGCGFWLLGLGLGALVYFWDSGVMESCRRPHRGTRLWATFSLPGCLALGFLELSVVQFLSLQDHEAGERAGNPGNRDSSVWRLVTR